MEQDKKTKELKASMFSLSEQTYIVSKSFGLAYTVQLRYSTF